MVVMTWSGDFFLVKVTSRPDEPYHRIHVLPKRLVLNGDTASGIHCHNDKARRELLRLIKVADALAAHLDAGGAMERWVS